MFKYIFFGTSEFGRIVIEELKVNGILPSLIVTTPDRKSGRGQRLTQSPVKKWAEENSIPTFQPEKLDAEVAERLSQERADLFLVASYGFIIPKSIINIPKRGVINIHPSLLPKLRGPSPIQTAILEDLRDTGVSIMLIDEKMDHGPILAQEKISIPNWPVKNTELEEILGKAGAMLFSKIVPDWLSGTIMPKEQNHNDVTFTKKFEKEDGLIDINSNPYKNYLKLLALADTTGVYFVTEKNGKRIRIKITSAIFKDGGFQILRVIPESRKEMKFEEFNRI